MTCGHRQIRTWVFEDTQQPSGLWSCVDCGLKFEPITQRTWVDLTHEEVESSFKETGMRITPDRVALVKLIIKKIKDKNT